MSSKSCKVLCIKEAQARHPWTPEARSFRKTKNGSISFSPDSWLLQEDALLLAMVEVYGLKRWSLVASALPCRGNKQCYERYHASKSILKASLLSHFLKLWYLASKSIPIGINIIWVLILSKIRGQDMKILRSWLGNLRLGTNGQRCEIINYSQTTRFLAL